MKKFWAVIFIFVFCSLLQAQDGIKYTVDTVEFTKLIDSTTVNDYTQLKVDWDKGYGNKWFTGGQYSLYFYADSAKDSDGAAVDTILVGDTDSLFIYVKERVPTTTEIDTATSIVSIEVSNDSTFITPSSGAAGLDFDLDKWYVFDFDLRRARGVDIFIKRQSDDGGLTYRFVITK